MKIRSQKTIAREKIRSESQKNQVWKTKSRGLKPTKTKSELENK